MKKITLDIILPVYNEEQDLSSSVETLVSFISTHLKEYKAAIVIADNASTDKTYEIAKAMTKNTPSFQAFILEKKEEAER